MSSPFMYVVKFDTLLTMATINAISKNNSKYNDDITVVKIDSCSTK